MAFCDLCGEPDCDLHWCADCGRQFCGECGDWCHAEGDIPNGDYFCEECQI